MVGSLGANILTYIKWLSMGTPLGAICVLALLEKEWHIDLPYPVYVCLFLALWLIYLLDHLIDSQAGNLITARRMFFRENSKLIVVLVSLIGVAGFWFMLQLPSDILKYGLLLSGACAGYLYLARQLGRWKVKELNVALGYATGIFLPILTRAPWNGQLALMWGELFLLAFVNLLVFSIYEKQEDQNEGFDSMATKLTDEACLKIAQMAFALLTVLALGALGAGLGSTRFNLFILAANTSLYLILRNPRFFQSNERYRFWGDAVFFIALMGLIV